MPSLTPSEAKMLGRRAERPEKAPGELLAVWVPGKLVNTKNARLHYMTESRYKRGWRDAVAQACWDARWYRVLQSQPTELLPGTKLVILGGGFDGQAAISNKSPKRVVFSARTHAKLDSDGLQVALAPVRDALIDCGVVDGDADKHGHEFVYLPCVIDRAHRGVEIRVSLLPPPPRGEG